MHLKVQGKCFCFSLFLLSLSFSLSLSLPFSNTKRRRRSAPGSSSRAAGPWALSGEVVVFRILRLKVEEEEKRLVWRREKKKKETKTKLKNRLKTFKKERELTDRHALGMDRAEVGVLEQVHDKVLRRLFSLLSFFISLREGGKRA